jgi:hypothetical protein
LKALRTAAFAIGAGLACVSVVTAQAPAPAPAENTGPNNNIVRRANGSYVYLSTQEPGRERGREDFQLLVHPDGSRTLIMWNETRARHSQIHAVLRVEANFRPLEAYVSYWSYGVFRGSGLVRVDGDEIRTQISGPTGTSQQILPVPAWFSIATHPLAADGWHQLPVRKKRGQQQSTTLINLDTAKELNVPILARVQQQPWQWLGEEKVTVPAGTFTTQRYRSGESDVWVMGEDRILVRFLWPSLGSDYVLTKYSTSAP